MTRTRPDGAPPAVFGRFEAEQPNARWVGDALHGPVVAGRKAIGQRDGLSTKTPQPR